MEFHTEKRKVLIIDTLTENSNWEVKNSEIKGVQQGKIYGVLICNHLNLDSSASL